MRSVAPQAEANDIRFDCRPPPLFMIVISTLQVRAQYVYRILLKYIVIGGWVGGEREGEETSGKLCMYTSMLQYVPGFYITTT